MKCIKDRLKKPWPYWIGGILLGILNVALLATTGVAWHVTSGFLLWGAAVLDFLGAEPLKWDFFYIFNVQYKEILLNHSLIINKFTILNIAVIIGSLIATLFASQFNIKKIKNRKQVIIALIGGIIMGYGARLASGCNIGSFLIGISSFSLHGWIYWIFITLGAFIGALILKKFIL
ncbi:TPA: YeeE/YedE family protein [Clostridium botulinum]|nr:YeeE/YedE family protein [Clostridium botulinum]